MNPVLPENAGNGYSAQNPTSSMGMWAKLSFRAAPPLHHGDTLRIYYGAADTSIAMATGSVQAMLQWLDERG
jgi:hypothetical protein